MILRNGLHSMTRSGKRTVLFVILIFLLSLTLSVSGGLWLYADRLIEECSTAYRCAAVLEYAGTADPAGMKEEPSVCALSEQLDITGIRSVNGVKVFMRRDLSLGLIEGYTRLTGFARDDSAVLMAGSFIRESDTHWIATVKETVYAFDCESGILINLVTEGTPFVPDKNTVYCIDGYFSDEGPQNGFRNFHVKIPESEDAPSWAAEGEDLTRFLKAAEDYASKNNAVMLEKAEDTEALPAFQQGNIRLTEGAFPTRENECVITEDIAQSLGLRTGSSLRMASMIPAGGSLYNTSGTEEYREYTVCGISSSTSDWRSFVWTVPSGTPSPLYGRLIGTFAFENAKAGEAYEELLGLMPEGTVLTLYDQGYSAAVSPLAELVSASSFLFIIAAGTMFFVLIFFMYVFTGIQEANIRTMVCLGTPDGKIIRWLMAGAAPVVTVSSLLGAAAGCFLLPPVLKLTELLKNLKDPFPSYYSEVAQGLQKPLPDLGSIRTEPVICIMLLFAVLSMLILYVFAGRMKRSALLDKGKTTVKIPKGTTDTSLRGPLRFAWLSARRGGLRSILVMLLSFVMCLSAAFTSSYTSEWKDTLSDASSRITTRGALVGPSGDILEEAGVQGPAVRHLAAMPEVTDLAVSVRWHYWFEDEMPAFAETGFGEEHRREWIDSRPFLYALNRADASQETCRIRPVITWADGYDESILTEELPSMFSFEMGFTTDPETYPAVITRTLAERRGLGPGDVFSVGFSHSSIMSRYTYYSSSNDMTDSFLTLRAAGILENDRGSESLFLPLSAYGSYLETDPAVTSSPRSVFNETQLREYLYMNSSYSYCAFTIRDGVSPDEFKDRLIEEGFSAPGHILRERTAVMLFDREYVLLRDGAKRFIRTGLRLTCVILVLTALISYILSYLSVNARRDEIRLMMTLGTCRKDISASFLLEEILLILPGLLSLPLIFITDENAGIFTVLSTVLYVLMYITGSAISIKAVMRSALISRTEV